MKALLFFLLAASRLFAGETITAGNFIFSPPKPWVVQDTPSHMLKGAATHGEKGPMVKFYHFGTGQGGGVEANVIRWKKQFEGEVKVTPEKLAYDKQEVTIVMMEGTFLDGGIMERKTSKEGYLLLGAIIPHANGDVFLKVTGPKADLSKAKRDFKKLVASAFTKEAK
jgi:hypothetical protein